MQNYQNVPCKTILKSGIKGKMSAVLRFLLVNGIQKI